MSRGYTIGANYDTTLTYINDPVSEYYIPYPVAGMDCATLQQNYTSCNNQVAYWTGILQNSTNNATTSNVSQIIQIQTAKAQQYSTAINQTCVVTPPPPDTSGDGKNNMLMIIAAAVAAMFFFRKQIFGGNKA